MSASHAAPTQAWWLRLLLVIQSPLEAEPPCLTGSWGSRQIPHPRQLLLQGRAEQGQSAPALQERGTLLHANSGKRDAHHERACQEAALGTQESWRLWCLRALAWAPRIPPEIQEALQKEPRPARRLPSPPHFSRTFHWLRVTPQMEPNAVGGNHSQLKTLNFVNFPPPHLLGL